MAAVVAVQIDGLGQVTKPVAGLRAANGLVEQIGPPRTGAEKIQQQLNGGGLAGAVGAEKAEHFGLVHGEIEAPQGGRAPFVGLAQVFCADDTHRASLTFGPTRWMDALASDLPATPATFPFRAGRNRRGSMLSAHLCLQPPAWE